MQTGRVTEGGGAGEEGRQEERKKRERGSNHVATLEARDKG